MMNNPRLLRYLARGINSAAGLIVINPWHGSTTGTILGAGLCLLIGSALLLEANRKNADR